MACGNNQRPTKAEANEFRLLKLRKKKLEDQEYSITDIVKAQEYQGEQIKHLKRILEKSIQPGVAHLLHLADKRELKKSLQETAANIIKQGKHTERIYILFGVWLMAWA